MSPSPASSDRAEIDRRDFGITFEGSLENGSLVVGNKIVLEFAVEAAAQQRGHQR